jgi:steroid delta-isomerase-like uncharacterized protein
MLTHDDIWNMSNTEHRTLARRFVQEIFNERKIEAAKNFVTPDIIYHGVLEEVRGLDEFKKWVDEDLSAFPDLLVTVLDDFGEKDKVAMRWTAKGTQEKEFADLAASHKKFELEGAEILHFEAGKIKEAWTIFDARELAQ